MTVQDLGLIEAAGKYCTRCLAPTGPADWSADPAHVRRGANAASQRPDKGGNEHAGVAADLTAPERPERPSPSEVLASHVQDVIAACNPELRSQHVPTSSEVPSGGSALLIGTSRDAGASSTWSPPPPDVPSFGF